MSQTGCASSASDAGTAIRPSEKELGSTLEIRDLEKRYGTVPAVQNISLNVPPGSFLTLLGPSGCGKTTLLRVIAGLTSSSQGTILLDGRDITGIRPEARDLGMLFQNYALFPHLSVRDNVAFGLKMHHTPRRDIDRRVRDALSLVRLEHVERRYPSQLSGGQQQRVALARVLVLHPKVLLLDEPLSALDRHLREHMQRELRALQKELGITTIMVTHDQREALFVSDWIAVMNKGRVEQFDAPAVLYDRPTNVFVAQFMGFSNLLAGEVVTSGSPFCQVEVNSSRLDAWSGFPYPAGQRILLASRPPQVSIGRVDDARQGVHGVVRGSHVIGSAILYEVRVGETTLEVEVPREGKELVPAQQERVKLIFHRDRTVIVQANSV